MFTLSRLLRHRRQTPAWAIWLDALAVTWLCYVAMNLLFSLRYFGHLDRLDPPTVGELHRLGGYASRASRSAELVSGAEARRPKANFADRMLVYRLRTTDGKPDPRTIDTRTVQTLYRLLSEEIDATPPRAGAPPDPAPPPQPANTKKAMAVPAGAGVFAVFQAPKPADPPKPAEKPKPGPGAPIVVPPPPSDEPAARLLKAELRLLRLRHAIPDELRGERDKYQKLLDENGRTDPWAKYAQQSVDVRQVRLDKRFEEIENVLQNDPDKTAISLGVMFRSGDQVREQEYRAYLADLGRLVSLDIQPHLLREAGVRPPAWDTSTLVVAYYPGPAGGGRSATGDWVFLMELSQRGSWWGGSAVEARFRLIDRANPDLPILNPQQPALEVLTRGPGWLGFRPTAVLRSEEQLAAQFFNQLEEISQGSRAEVPLPKADERQRYQHFLHRLLLERLGQPTSADRSEPFSAEALADPAGQFQPAPRPMDDWVVWARRLNGGTGWGWVQFAVVWLCVLFALNAAVLWAMIRRLEQAGGAANPGPLVPDDWRTPYATLYTARHPPRGNLDPAAVNAAEAELARVIRRRFHTLSAITVILPLVGFLGTVAGLSNSLIGSTGVSSESIPQRQAALQAMEIALGTAFDKSMLAFFGSILCTLALRWFFWRSENVD